MKAIYEQPEVEVIDFQARENLAVIEDEVKNPEVGVGSRDF